jgi:hypothetical protein
VIGVPLFGIIGVTVTLSGAFTATFFGSVSFGVSSVFSSSTSV